jgi:putative transcriptional regulator
MMEIRLDQLLAARERTFYWLAKETGISHTTLWRLKKGKALGINFDTLVKICTALECQPGDVMTLASEKQKTGTRTNQRARGARKR